MTGSNERSLASRPGSLRASGAFVASPHECSSAFASDGRFTYIAAGASGLSVESPPTALRYAMRGAANVGAATRAAAPRSLGYSTAEAM